MPEDAAATAAAADGSAGRAIWRAASPGAPARRGLPTRSPRSLAVCGAAVVFASALALRLAHVLGSPDWNSTEQHELGLFAAHVSAGLLAPARDYQVQGHHGCQILLGLGCMPAVAALGPTIGALRVCTAALHACLAAVVYLIALRAGGLRGGAVAAALAVAASPTILHYATMGRANHLDATLMGGLALLLLAASMDGSRRRVLVLAAAAGASGALGVVYYLDSAPALLGVLLALCTIRGTHRRVRWAAIVAGLAAGMLVPAAWGLRPWTGILGVVGGEGAGTHPPLPERAWTALAVGLPGALGYRGSSPFLLSFVYLGSLCAMAARGLAEREAALPVALVRRAAAAAVAMTLLAVVGSGVDTSYRGYFAPVWTWLVVAGCGGAPRGARSRPPRARSLAASLLSGSWWAAAVAVIVTAFLLGQPRPLSALRPDAGAALQAPAANLLRAGRLADHPIGQRLVDRLGSADLLALARRPEDRADLLRLAGRRALSERRPSCPAREVPLLAARARPAEAPWMWEGAGEAWVGRLRSCHPPAGGVDEIEPIVAGLASTRTPPGLDPSLVGRFWDGAALAAAAYAVGRLDALAPLASVEGARDALCSATGRWGWVARRGELLVGWAAQGPCSRATLAEGWGRGYARDLWPPGEEPRVTPSLSWFWPGVEPAEEAAFSCGLRAERERVAAATAGLVAGDLACVPPE